MKIETQECIARNLRTLRTSSCISQAELANKVGINRALYASYELGNRTPDAEILYMIASKFNIEVGALFEQDHYKFLSLLASHDIYDDELSTLINCYRELSSFAKGMLIERATWLKEWDKVLESNKKALAERRAGIL